MKKSNFVQWGEITKADIEVTTAILFICSHCAHEINCCDICHKEFKETDTVYCDFPLSKYGHICEKCYKKVNV